MMKIQMSEGGNSKKRQEGFSIGFLKKSTHTKTASSTYVGTHINSSAICQASPFHFRFHYPLSLTIQSINTAITTMVNSSSTCSGSNRRSRNGTVSSSFFLLLAALSITFTSLQSDAFVHHHQRQHQHRHVNNHHNRAFTASTETSTTTTSLSSSSSSSSSPSSKSIVAKRVKSVNYFISRQCNYECKFCFHTQTNTFKLSMEEAKRGLQLLADAGTEKINFAGEFFELVFFCAFFICVRFNGH